MIDPEVSLRRHLLPDARSLRRLSVAALVGVGGSAASLVLSEALLRGTAAVGCGITAALVGAGAWRGGRSRRPTRGLEAFLRGDERSRPTPAGSATRTDAPEPPHGSTGGPEGLTRDDLRLAEALRSAVGRHELVLYYQPIISAETLHVCGVEALLRWRHPDRGLLGPDTFLPLAERCGLIPSIGAWALRQACSEARRWPDLRLAVNVSPTQFRHVDFMATVARILAETAFDPNRLEIEMTESVIIEDAAQAELCMIELRAMGIRLAIDDFGTGYSSLIYLRRFAFDKMKIDKSFVQLLETRGESAVIVDAIVKLGQALGLTVTAEGIETLEQQTYLRRLGCNELQGYLYSQPVAADDIDALLSLTKWHEPPIEGASARSVA